MAAPAAPVFHQLPAMRCRDGACPVFLSFCGTDIVRRGKPRLYSSFVRLPYHRFHVMPGAGETSPPFVWDSSVASLPLNDGWMDSPVAHAARHTPVKQRPRATRMAARGLSFRQNPPVWFTSPPRSRPPVCRLQAWGLAAAPLAAPLLRAALLGTSARWRPASRC